MDNGVADNDLAGRYHQMKAAGLVDVKFLLRNRDEATVEQVKREVSAMYDALARGDSKPLDFNDKTIK